MERNDLWLNVKGNYIFFTGTYIEKSFILSELEGASGK